MPRRNLRRGRRKAFGFGSGAYGVVFLLPYLLFLIAFGAAPVVYALLLSFQGHGSIGLSYTLGAYRFAVNDPEFRGAAKHVIEFALVVSPIFLVVVTFLALVLRACPDRVASAFSLAYFLPAAVSSSVVVLLWLLMLDPSSSPYRSALHVFGWTSIASVVNRGNYLLIFATMFLWSTVGGWLLITHSALKNVSKEIVGAAKIDGCGPLGLARYIYLPMIRKTLVLMTVLVFAAASQLYNEPTVLSTFTFDNVPWALNQLSYRMAFQFGFFKASAAVAMMLVGLTLVLSIPLVWRFNFTQDTGT